MNVLRSIELKALELSSFKSTLGSTEWLIDCRVSWTADSHLIRTPTPNWQGNKSSLSEFMTECRDNLENKRRKVFPTAIGRIPPPFFWRAYRWASKNKCLIESGILVDETKEANQEIDRRTEFALAPREGDIMSFKCWGRSKSGPEPESLRKERTRFPNRRLCHNWCCRNLFEINIWNWVIQGVNGS